MKYFPLYLFTSRETHSATADVIGDVVRVVAIRVAAQRLGSPQDPFDVFREFSS